MSLEERKQVLRSVIGGISVNRIEPLSEEDEEEPRQVGPQIRTRRLSVHIQLKVKTPESLDSGASGRKSVNRTVSGSDLDRTGSPGRIRTTNLMVNSHPLYH